MSSGTSSTASVWPLHEEYCNYIDIVARVLGFDLELADIREFKKEAYHLIANADARGPQFFLNMLSPQRYATLTNDGWTLVLEGNLVLQPWTIANWFRPGFAAYAVKIVIDGEDTRVYGVNDMRLVRFTTKVSPHQNVAENIEQSLGEYRRAALLIQGITGLGFSWKHLAAYTDAITLVRERPTDAWQAKFDRRLKLVPGEIE